MNASSRRLRLAERCPRCEFRFERREGQLVGAVGVNTVVTFAVVMLTLLIVVAIMAPDLRIGPILLVCLPVAVLFPLVFFPVSKTLWGAIDLVIDPLEPGEAPGLDRNRPLEGSGQE